MKGYAFLNSDHILGYRTKEYIDVENPFFWQQNKYGIVRKWAFDTEDMESMLFLFRQCKDLLVQPNILKDFCKMIDINPKMVSEYVKEQKNAS